MSTVERPWMTPNMQVWLNELRTTSLPQSKGYLCKRTNDGLAYCCLGLGSVLAGIEKRPVPYGSVFDFRDGVLPNGPRTRLPGEGFIKWLGLETGPDWPLYNLRIMWPTGLRSQGTPDGVDSRELGRTSSLGMVSGLNDEGMSFAQIADVIEYFGVKAVRA